MSRNKLNQVSSVYGAHRVCTDSTGSSPYLRWPRWATASPEITKKLIICGTEQDQQIKELRKINAAQNAKSRFSMDIGVFAVTFMFVLLVMYRITVLTPFSQVSDPTPAPIWWSFTPTHPSIPLPDTNNTSLNHPKPPTQINSNLFKVISPLHSSGPTGHIRHCYVLYTDNSGTRIRLAYRKYSPLGITWVDSWWGRDSTARRGWERREVEEFREVEI
jgi:hypothetical protein